MQTKQYKVLQQISIGKQLADEEAKRLMLVGTIQEVGVGTEFLVEGAASNSLHVLLRGEAEVLKVTEAGKLRRLATCGTGEVFGEIGLISNVPYFATVRAMSPCVVFVLQREAFGKMLAIGDSAAIKIVIELGRVLGDKWQKLTNGIVQLSDDHNTLHKTIKQLKAASSLEELEQARLSLLTKSQQLKAKYTTLQNQLYSLSPPPEPQKSRRGAELTLAIATGTAATVAIIYFLGGFQSLLSLFSGRNPDAAPQIAVEECQSKPHSTWRNGECVSE
ncbi:MAG: cyclic nucleotide-binding domain-containing protein [Cyanophyceae cyanobacterium]